MKPQPLIAVRDVEESSRWYQRLLGCRSGHGGPEYERLVDPEGRIVLQLHAWQTQRHEHEHMGDPALKPYGNGVLLWFEVADFDAAVERVRRSAVEILSGPLVNPNAQHREIWLRDRDGYAVVLSSARGDL